MFEGVIKLGVRIGFAVLLAEGHGAKANDADVNARLAKFAVLHGYSLIKSAHLTTAPEKCNVPYKNLSCLQPQCGTGIVAPPILTSEETVMEFLKANVDYIILGILGLMSLIMLWKVLERYIFLARVDVRDYPNIHELNIDLERNLTPIYTIGSNAPYVGLLRTVTGILITFYDMGQHGGNIDAAQIMVGLALALKATALGILVAIP